MYLIILIQKNTIQMISTFVIRLTVILFLSSCINAYTQDELTDQFNSAYELYNSENYFDAVTEFKRLLFFDDEDKYTYSSNYYIGRSYKAGAKFSDAIRYFTLAEIESGSLNDFFRCRIEIIKCNILRRTTDRAIQMIDELLANPEFRSEVAELYYWKGWAFIFSNKWKEASEIFKLSDDGGKLSKVSEQVNESLYSVTLAEVLSHLVPGSGQFYTGEYFSGALSFAWNLLFGYLTITSFVEDRIFDGFIIGNFLWLRFYTGNVSNARSFAEEKNQIIINSALDKLQFEFNGKKPTD